MKVLLDYIFFVLTKLRRFLRFTFNPLNIDFLVLMGVLILFSGSVFGMKVALETSTFTPKDYAVEKTMVVENQSNITNVYRVNLTRYIVDKFGKEDLSNKTNDFMVYPTEFRLKPGEKKDVQITWVGVQRDPKEEIFQLKVVPEITTYSDSFVSTLYLSTTNTDFNMKAKYQGVVYKDNSPYIRVLLENYGYSHINLETLKLSLYSQEGIFSKIKDKLKSYQLSDYITHVSSDILPGRQNRILDLPLNGDVLASNDDSFVVEASQELYTSALSF